MRKTLSERILTIPNKLSGGRDRRDDVSYGPHEDMKYDEFPNDGPIVMFWHGGSWTTGNKEMYRFVGNMLQKLGAHAIVMGYPRFPKQTFPGFIDDATRAIEFVRAQYPNRKIYAMGHSAGGHTALIAAMTHEVDGVIAIAAPCNLSERYWSEVFGDSFKDKKHDPRTYVASSKRQPKFLLIHGAIDHTVLVADSISLHRRLKKNKLQSELSVIKLANHFTILPLLVWGPLFRTRAKIKQFILSER